MTTRADLPRSLGLWLALLQLLMTLGWTAYVIYLPQLAAAVGIPGSTVILLLMLDQAIFTVTDFALGVAADRIIPVVGWLGRLVATLTAASCVAFLMLPWIAQGHAGATAFIGLAVVWAVTSSALRAPPLMLLGKYAARPSIPWMASLALLGFGVAGALAPYLTVALRTIDPRWPFLLASVALVLTSFALAPIERRLAAAAGQAKTVPDLLAQGSPGAKAVPFALAVVVLGLAFQVHLNINAPKLFLRFAKPADLEVLMPVFWGGFNIAMFAAAPLVRRWGGVLVMGAAALCAGLLALLATQAAGLPSLIILQFCAGAAWGVMMMSAVAAALAIGAPGSEGRLVGMLYSALAAATFVRMSMMAAGSAADPAYGALFAWLPAVAWAGGGTVLLALAGNGGRRMS